MSWIWCRGTDEDGEPCDSKAERYSYNGKTWSYYCEDCGWTSDR